MDAERRWVRRSRAGAVLVAVLMNGLGRGAASAEEGANPQATASAAQGTSRDPEGILNLDLDQLAKTPVAVGSGIAMNEPVTSVTKEASTIGKSAAAVFVITNEMIRRSGAKCIPEALRMAPGLEVAQVNSNAWAITCRGFNGGLADKLLVLIDGRTVYTPVFGGVYWDIQDVLLEDVDRIEVIRGPGGTLWGSNAVNGVINIITKNAKDTQGVYLNAGGGTVERSTGAFRYGGKIGDDCQYRVYGKYFDDGPFIGQDFSFFGPPTQRPGYDSWNQGHVGFRTDWTPGRDKADSITVQGDHYVGNTGGMGVFTSLQPPYSQTLYGNTYNTGENLLARWHHTYDQDSDWQLQSYFDNVQRDTILNDERVKTFDIDCQYRFPLGDRQEITCGAGYRYIHDDLPTNDPFFNNIPTQRSYFVGSQFVQDEISLSPDLLKMILGCKLEQNSYTYFEYQPTIRALYTPDDKHTLWGAVSRAVHTPTRVDQDMDVVSAFWSPPYPPLFLQTIGNPDEKSEALLAYELGYREQTTEKFSWDLATFYNVYDDLRSEQFLGPQPPYGFWLYQMANGAAAQTYGVELAMNYVVSERWRLSVNYTYLHMYIYGDTSIQGDGNSPCNQVYLHSTWNLRENVDFDLMARYVDSLSYRDYSTGALVCPSYIELDLRLAWRPRKNLELAVVGQNLLQTYHYEFVPTEDLFTQLNEIPRSVYGTATWRY